jgi:hypothetical protein
VSSPPFIPRRKQIQFPKRRVFCSLEYRTMEKVKNPVILCVIHHRQNPLESTKLKVIVRKTEEVGTLRLWALRDSKTKKEFLHIFIEMLKTLNPNSLSCNIVYCGQTLKPCLLRCIHNLEEGLHIKFTPFVRMNLTT